MSETGDLLQESARRLFVGHCDQKLVARAEAGEWPDGLWHAIEQAGFAAALVPEEAGGAGVGMADALGVLRAAGGSCAPVPLAETMVANWLLATSGLSVEAGPHSIAPVSPYHGFVLAREADGWRLTGHAARVPWAHAARSIAVLALARDEPMVVRLRPDQHTPVPGRNLAGEPRDNISVDTRVAPDAVAEAPRGFGLEQLQLLGAVTRTILIAGALATVLDMTVRYAQERVQFGRPIGKFQAIQQSLAVLAGQVAAAGAAADLAQEAAANGFHPLTIAAAKARAGEAASVGAAIAHQVHGAIGFTQEHRLNHRTRRLWSWRDEFGSEATWNRLVGEIAAKAGGEQLWATITAAG
jgi:acyl-CoA dehydrogenase